MCACVCILYIHMNTHRLKTTYMHACRFMFIRVQICTGAANAAPRQLLRQVIGRARSQARAQYVHVHTIRVRVCVLCVFTRVQVIGYNQRVNMYFDTYIEVCTCAHPLSRARTELGFRESWTGWIPPSPLVQFKFISNFTPASHVIRGSRQRITCVVQRITSLNQSGDVLRHIR